MRLNKSVLTCLLSLFMLCLLIGIPTASANNCSPKKRTAKVQTKTLPPFGKSPRSTVVRTRNSKCIAEIHYDKSGKVIKFNLLPAVPGEKVPNGPYTEYHAGSRVKRATYNYKNGKLNGVYREFDRYGRQILGVPVRNDRPDGNAWFLEDGERALKGFRGGKMNKMTREKMSKIIVEKLFEANELRFIYIKPVKSRKGILTGDQTEYYPGNRRIRSNYSFKNGKLNGVYREYDRNGQQIMEIPLKDNRVSGDGWILKNRKRTLKSFSNGKIGKRIIPTFKEHLTPEQVDQKIATFRSRIADAPEELIPGIYKPQYLEAFDNLVKTRIGRYVFEKAHPDISFAAKELKCMAGVFSSGNKRITLEVDNFIYASGDIEGTLIHEAAHSVIDVNRVFHKPDKSVKEKLMSSSLNELHSTLMQEIAYNQKSLLQKKRNRRFFGELYNAKVKMGADEKSAERFARTKYVEAVWRNNTGTIRVGNKDIQIIIRDLSRWGYEEGMLSSKKRSMQDVGIDECIKKFIHATDIDTPVSFFREPPFEIPDPQTIIWKRNGFKHEGNYSMPSSGSVMTKKYSLAGLYTLSFKGIKKAELTPIVPIPNFMKEHKRNG